MSADRTPSLSPFPINASRRPRYPCPPKESAARPSHASAGSCECPGNHRPPPFSSCSSSSSPLDPSPPAEAPAQPRARPSTRAEPVSSATSARRPRTCPGPAPDPAPDHPHLPFPRATAGGATSPNLRDPRAKKQEKRKKKKRNHRIRGRNFSLYSPSP